MRSPEDILEHLRIQSDKHKNDPGYKFNEMTRFVLNPMLYPGIEGKRLARLLSDLADESFKPSGDVFTKFVCAAAQSLLEAVYPRQAASRVERAAEAVKSLSGARWLFSFEMGPASAKTAIGSAMRKVSDPRFERLLLKLAKWGGYERSALSRTVLETARLGLDELALHLALGMEGAGFARLGPEMVFGAGRLGDARRAAQELEGFLRKELLDFSPVLVPSRTARFLSLDLRFSDGGVKAFVPPEAVKDTLVLIGAADTRVVPWRGKRIERLAGMGDMEILGFYNSQIDGFAALYSQACGFRRERGKFCRILRMSFLHTMAAARRSTVRRVAKELGAGGGLRVGDCVLKA